MENKTEIWKDIEGSEGIYQVSNFGRIKSFCRGKGKILNGSLSSTGYFQISLHLKNKKEHQRIHRLVAEAFLGKFDLYVNHKDGNKTNNNIENLEYTTNRDNAIHGYNSKKTSSKYAGVCWVNQRSKWKAQIHLNGKRKFLGHFDTELEAYNAYLQALKDNGIKSKYA